MEAQAVIDKFHTLLQPHYVSIAATTRELLEADSSNLSYLGIFTTKGQSIRDIDAGNVFTGLCSLERNLGAISPIKATIAKIIDDLIPTIRDFIYEKCGGRTDADIYRQTNDFINRGSAVEQLVGQICTEAIGNKAQRSGCVCHEK